MANDPGEVLNRLAEVMAKLRADGGCPWDREQDLKSLRPYLVEETYEVLEEMDRVSSGGSWASLCEELGDLLFQIVFHAQLAREVGEFELRDVVQAITEKIVRRHPHVFGEAKVDGAQQVLANWAQLKALEKKKKTGNAGSVLDGVPADAPALLRAERLTEKASRIGFDWPNIEGVMEKLREELAELTEAVASNDKAEIEHELGDVLFSLANLGRFLQVPCEDALRQANRRFTDRFHHIEAGLSKENVSFGKATLPQMEALWKEAKRAEKSMPKTRHPPLGGALVRVQVPCLDLDAARRFWTEVASELGLRAEGGMLPIFTDGRCRLVLQPLPQGRTHLPTALTFEAPNAPAVSAFKGWLSRRGISHAVGREDAAAITFRDPSGNEISYVFGAS